MMIIDLNVGWVTCYPPFVFNQFTTLLVGNELPTLQEIK